MDSKNDVTSEKLLEKLNKIKQEISGLREENVQAKEELDENETAHHIDDEVEEIINLQDVLKIIESNKSEEVINDSFTSEVQVTSMEDVTEHTGGNHPTFEKQDDVNTHDIVTEEIHEVVSENDNLVLDNIGSENVVEVENTITSAKIEDFISEELLKETSNSMEKEVLDLSIEESLSKLDSPKKQEENLERSSTQASSAIGAAHAFEEMKEESTEEVSFTQALNDVLGEAQDAKVLEETEKVEEHQSSFIDVPLVSNKEQKEKLSLTMILSDTQELSTFMIESEIQQEKERRANAKNFDLRSSEIDEDGNIINHKKKSRKYIIIAFLIIVMILLFDTGLLARLSDREAPKVELETEVVYVTAGQEYELTDGIVISDDETSEEYLMENVMVESNPEFSTDVTGSYIVTYSVKDEVGNKTEATQTVNVVPAGYELVLTVPSDDLVVQVGEDVDLMVDVSANNGLDDTAALSSSVEVSSEPDGFNTDEPGTYEITYSVTDSVGNTAEEKRTVIVEGEGSSTEEKEDSSAEEEEVTADIVPPSVTISEPDITISAGDSYDITTGVSVSDNVSSEDYIWSSMQALSTPPYNPSIPGIYDITLTFTDEAGNSTTVSRVIRVL